MKGGGASSKSQWQKKKGHKTDKHGSPHMKDSFVLTDETNEVKRVDTTLQWSAAFTGMLAEQFGQEVAKAFEDQDKIKFNKLLYGSSEQQIRGLPMPNSPTIIPQSHDSRSAATAGHELTLDDLCVSGMLSPVKENPDETQHVQRAHEAASTSAPKPRRGGLPTLDEVEAAPTETLLSYCRQNKIQVKNENHATLMMAVVRHILQRQEEHEESEKAYMEATQADRLHSSRSNMMRDDEDSLAREREKAQINIQVKKEMENKDKIKRIMGKMWNSLWREFQIKLQRDAMYIRAVEALDIIDAFKIIIEYNLYGINSSRDDRDPSVITIRESVQTSMRNCIHRDRDDIEIYNKRYTQLAFLSVYVKAGWSVDRVILLYIQNLSPVFGHKKIDWQDPSSDMRNETSLAKVMDLVTREWNKLLARKAITHDRDSGKYQDANLQQILREVGKMFQLKPQTPTTGAKGQQASKSGPQVCRFFAQGKCKFGDKCTRAHDKSGETVAAATSTSADDPICDWCNSKHSRTVKCETEKRAMKKWRKENQQDADTKNKTSSASNQSAPFGQKPKNQQQRANQVAYYESSDDDDFSCIIRIEDACPSETVADEYIHTIGDYDEPKIMSDSGSSIDLANTSLLQNIQQKSKPFWVYDFHNGKTSINSSGKLMIEDRNLGVYAAHPNVRGAIQSFSKQVATRDHHWCVDPFARYKILRDQTGAVIMYILQDRRGTFTRALTDVAKNNRYEDFIRDFKIRFPNESPDTIFWKARDLFQPLGYATFKVLHEQLQIQAAKAAEQINAMHTRQTSKRLASQQPQQPNIEKEDQQPQQPNIEEEEPQQEQDEQQHPSEQIIQEEPIQCKTPATVEQPMQSSEIKYSAPPSTVTSEDSVDSSEDIIDTDAQQHVPPKVLVKAQWIREMHYRTGSQRDPVFQNQVKHVFRSKTITNDDIRRTTEILGPNTAYIRSRYTMRAKDSQSMQPVSAPGEILDWDITYHGSITSLQVRDRYDGYMMNIAMKDASANSFTQGMQYVRATLKGQGHGDKVHIGKSDNASVITSRDLKAKLLNQYNINLQPKASHDHCPLSEAGTNAFRQTLRALKASSKVPFLECMQEDLLLHATDIFNMKPNSNTGNTTCPWNMRHTPLNLEEILCKPGDLVIYWAPLKSRDTPTKRNKDPNSDINEIMPALTKDRNAQPGKFGIVCRQHFDVKHKFSVYDIEKGTMLEAAKITVIPHKREFIQLMNRRMIEEQEQLNGNGGTSSPETTDAAELERIDKVKGSLKPSRIYATRWKVYWKHKVKPEWVSIDTVWGTAAMQDFLAKNPDIQRKIPQELPPRVDTNSANQISYGDMLYITQKPTLDYCYFQMEEEEETPPQAHYFGDYEIDPTVNLLTKEKVIQKYGAKCADDTVYAELKSVIDRSVISLPQPGDPVFTELLRMNGHYEEKTDPAFKEQDKLKFRACLGGDKQKVKKQHSASPTARQEHVNGVLCASMFNDYTINIGDVPAAFLNADAAYKDGANYGVIIPKQYVHIVLKIKPEWSKHVNKNGTLTLALKKAWYGAKEAALWFYMDISNYLIESGYRRTIGDPCIFDLVTEQNEHSILVLHVDDILFAGTNAKVNQDIRIKLEQKYGPLKWQDGDDLKYLGQHIKLDYKEKAIFIDQFKYIEKLFVKFKPSGIAKTPSGKDFFDPAPDSKAHPMSSKFYRSLVMSISFLAQRTFPEILKEVGFLATRQQLPTLFDYEKAQRVINYVNYRKDRPLVLRATSMKMTAYADASYGVHLPDLKSHGGTTIMLGGAPILNKSKKIPQRTTSSCHAETIQLYQCTNQVLSLHSLLKELRFKHPVEDVPTIFQDNQSTIRLSEPGFHNKSVRSRNFQIQYFYIREAVEQQLIRVEYLPTQDMVADIHTKPLQGKLFTKFRDILLGNDPNVQPTNSTEPQQ